eukprot:g6418.t1
MDANWKRRLNRIVQELTEQKLLRHQKAIQPSTSSVFEARVVEGSRSSPVKLFASNDYLGLADHPELRHACAQSAALYGMGVRSSALICGYSPLHNELETRLAAHTKKETCLLFPTGFAANVAVISVLGDGSEVAVFSDALNHASIVDGCRLAARSGAQIKIYRHNDAVHLESILSNCTRALKVVVTESLFSMDGDFAQLKTLVALKEKYGLLLVVDEAHAMLVAGETGGGISEFQNVQNKVLYILYKSHLLQVDIVIGTLSKAFGSMGGFICTTKQLRDLLLTKGRTQMFSTALPIPNVAAALSALHISQR